MVDREQIQTNGWCQGVVIDTDQQATFEVEICADEVLILISQDCDILHRSYVAEPTIAVLKAIKVDSPDGNITYGKNPRKIQIPITIDHDDTVYYEILAHSIAFLPRQKLEIGIANKRYLIESEAITLLTSWFAARFTRLAFPDNFVSRWDGNKAKVQKLLKKNSASIYGIYIAIKSMEELAVDVPYSVSLLGSLKVEDWEDAECQSLAHDVLAELASLLESCDGIELDDYNVLPESEISLNDMRFYRKWDFDHVSFKSGGAAEVPPG